MYGGCDYPYKSCLCTFWPCRPYFILQFYSIVFILVSVPFFYYLGVVHQWHLTWFAHWTPNGPSIEDGRYQERIIEKRFSLGTGQKPQGQRSMTTCLAAPSPESRPYTATARGPMWGSRQGIFRILWVPPSTQIVSIFTEFWLQILKNTQNWGNSVHTSILYGALCKILKMHAKYWKMGIFILKDARTAWRHWDSSLFSLGASCSPFTRSSHPHYCSHLSLIWSYSPQIGAE